MMKFTEAENSFYEDIREKKRTASGIHHKTGSRGYVGKMRFPTDIMSRKDKYNYRKAGKVMISNLMDEILTIDEFENLEKIEQKRFLEYWRSKYTNLEITEKMGIWNARYYKIVAELGLPKAPRINKTVPQRRAAAKVIANNPKSAIAVAEAPVIEAAPIIEAAAPVKESVQEIIVHGLHLVYTGTFTPEEIIKQLTKFELLLDGEPDEFYIELKLVQKQRKEEV